MTAALEIRNVSVTYGRTGLALDDVSLNVPRGGIVALLGANGAGKTTLIRAISGLLVLHGGKQTSGSIAFAGRNVLGVAPHKLVRSGMAQVPEGRLVFKQLAVEENLLVGAAVLPRAQIRPQLEAIYTMFPKLADRRRQLAGWLSGGEQQMLAMGRALITKPSLLLVDELSLGLAPLVVESIYQQLQVAGRTLDTSMLIVEQNASLALEFATSAFILERGRIVRSGLAADLAASDAVRNAYLGAKVRQPVSGDPA